MGIGILLADDHKLMREGLRTLIEEQPDMRVVAEAEDGKTAVRLAAGLSPDIVIMDISMPGLNGIEATRQLLAADPSSKVIGLSMHLDKVMILEMFKAGAVGYLLKDCDFEEVLCAIANAKAESGYISPRAAELLIREFNAEAGQRQAEMAAPFEGRKREVLELMLKGKRAKETAAALKMSTGTVESLRQQLLLNHLVPFLNRKSADPEGSFRGELTLREREILIWVKEGKNNGEIASILGITLDTVKFHVKNIFQKLQVANRSQAVSVALEHRLLE